MLKWCNPHLPVTAVEKSPQTSDQFKCARNNIKKAIKSKNPDPPSHVLVALSLVLLVVICSSTLRGAAPYPRTATCISILSAFLPITISDTN